MNYILKRMEELNADGVDFLPIGIVLSESKDCFGKVIVSYTKEQCEKGIENYPQRAYLFWKMESGLRRYL